MSLLGDLGTAIKNKLGGASVDNTVPRYDGTTCKLQGSGVTISDTNVVTASGGFVGNLTGNATSATSATSAISAISATSATSAISAISATSATSATKLSTTNANWFTNGTIDNAVGMLGWKNYGNGHVIFDASNGTSPTGTAVNNTNAQTGWSSSSPTLMGWNGGQTYGVRVDSARVADAFSTTSGSAPSYACRAWVNFDGTGTVAIRASGNVSSITDNGTGNYTVNFTTAMPDANYATLVTSSVAINSSDSAVKSNFTTSSSVRVYSMTATGENTDSSYLGVSIFG